MWPSNTEVKNTLNQTGVLLFRNGNLQLNQNINLNNTILEKELLISSIDRLNAIFDQEEKLKLAILLRDYIYGCKDLEQIQLEKQNFWKDYYQFLKHLLEIPLLSLLVIIFTPVIIPIKWMVLRFDFWSAEKKQLKNKQNLDSSIKNTINLSSLINPLTLDYGHRLFEIPEKKEIVETAKLSTEELIEKLAEITDIFSKKFEKHIGADSTYELKDDLRSGLELIYYHLNGNLGPVTDHPIPPEKIPLLCKLREGIDSCSAGFHDRVNTIIESFNTIGNFNELLFLVRKSLVEKIALEQMRNFKFFTDSGNEIHTYHDFSRIAHQEGFGIPLGTDQYRGDMSWYGIRKALEKEFENSYTPFNLPSLLTDILKGLLVEVGYTGAKQNGSYTVGTDESEVEKITQFIKKLLDSDLQNTDWKDFFIINDYNITDINWEFIKAIFFKQLIKENYFKIYADEEFNQHLLNLINHIENTNDNYFRLLAQIQPKSFYLLFKSLEKNQSKESQEKLIPLFFLKDETDLAPLPLIVHNNPEILKRFFCFTDSDPYSKKITQTLLIEHKNMTWDSFVFASEKQTDSAFIFLNYIIQHPELFEFDSCTNSLFSENLSKIQQGMCNLITQRSLNHEQKVTLLSFLTSCSAALPHPSQKVVDFLFDSLNHCDDEQLIKKLISEHSALLLKNFSVNYFKNQTKNLALVTEKLLDVYANELSDRENSQVKYITQFFNWNFGYSTTEKLKALTVIKDILNNNSNIEKIEQLIKAKADYPALSNGRLSCLFKACTHDSEITSHIKIQAQI